MQPGPLPPGGGGAQLPVVPAMPAVVAPVPGVVLPPPGQLAPAGGPGGPRTVAIWNAIAQATHNQDSQQRTSGVGGTLRVAGAPQVQQPFPAPANPMMGAQRCPPGQYSAFPMRPGQQQLAYPQGAAPANGVPTSPYVVGIPGIGPGTRGDPGPCEPTVAGVPGRWEYCGGLSFTNMQNRCLCVPYNSCPLAITDRGTLGQKLPLYMYTRNSVNLIGSHTPANLPLPGYQTQVGAPPAVNAPQPPQPNPIVFTDPVGAPPDRLRNFWFVPRHMTPVQDIPIAPVLAYDCGQNNTPDILAHLFTSPYWQPMDEFCRDLGDEVHFVGGQWWFEDVGTATANLQTFIGQVGQPGGQWNNLVPQNMVDGQQLILSAQHWANALMDQFHNSFGREAVERMLNILKGYAMLATHLVVDDYNQQNAAQIAAGALNPARVMRPPGMAQISNNNRENHYAYITCEINGKCAFIICSDRNFVACKSTESNSQILLFMHAKAQNQMIRS